MALLNSDCKGLHLVARGKVRDIYEVDSNHLLFVATDRVSAFDVVMKNGVPGKGRILTEISAFWFKLLCANVQTHFVTSDVKEMPVCVGEAALALGGRCMLVRKLSMLPVEAIVRGYLAGTGWKEYQKSGTVCGIQLPPGLSQGARLPKPIFTPSTKAELGTHDENISLDKLVAKIGLERANQVKDTAILIYNKAAEHALKQGLILVDTKFEFGIDSNNNLCLGDEVLTPDSSRYWTVAEPRQAFDKQCLRDFLSRDESFDNTNGIYLPEKIINELLDRYQQLYQILTKEIWSFRAVA